MKPLIVFLLVGCSYHNSVDHFDEKINPEHLTFVAAEKMDQVRRVCGWSTDACITQVGKNAVIIYQKGRIDSIWHERKHIENPEKFALEFASEFGKYRAR